MMFPCKFAVTVAALLSSALLSAQVDPKPARPAQTPPGAAESDRVDPAKRGATVEGDTVLATWALSSTNHELALAKLAMQRAKGEEVREFAQMLIEQHGEFALKLQPFVVTDKAAERKPESIERTGTAATRQPVEASARAETADKFDHVALIRELGAKFLATDTRMLSEKPVAEFDACYMRLVVLSHARSVDMLTVFGSHASDKLRPTFEAGLKVTKSHLDAAVQLCKATEAAVRNDDGNGNGK